MKSRNIFIGSILILVGIVMGLIKLNLVSIDPILLLQLWPAILIFAGFSSFFHSKWRWLIAAGLTLALLMTLGGIAQRNNWLNLKPPSTKSESDQHFEVPFSSEIQSASLSLKTGAGAIKIGGKTNQLFESDTKATFGEYNLEHTEENQSAKIEFMLKRGGLRSNFRTVDHSAQISLHAEPHWQIDIDLGAAEAELDLSNQIIDTLHISSGATDVNLKLGDLAERSDVSIDTGVSSFKIAVPRNVGCQIITHTGLSDKNFLGFDEIDNKTYQTKDFATAPHKIYLDLKAGLSDLEVTRY